MTFFEGPDVVTKNRLFPFIVDLSGPIYYINKLIEKCIYLY